MLDLSRISAAAIIFMGHGANQFGHNYYFLQPLVKLRGFAMTLFFMLSGLVNFVGNERKNLLDIINLKNIYLKRMIAIIPLYYLAGTLYAIKLGQLSIVDNVKLASIEFFGFQSAFNSLFSYAHNGGTWFISCLLFAYFVSPCSRINQATSTEFINNC